MAELQPIDRKDLEATIEEDEEVEPGQAGKTEAPEAAEPEVKSGKKKKKASKKSKDPAGSTGDQPTSSDSKSVGSKMKSHVVDQVLEMNPALRGELSNLDKKQAAEVLKKMDVAELLTGLSLGGTNRTDMASHKFWRTQPVPKFDEKPDQKAENGPIQEVVPDLVPKNPAPLPEGYEWCELDLTREDEIQEVYQLLSYHYVEDDNAMFRFNYSQSFLNWALKSPEWKRSWHIGVRASKSRLLVASIFGIPIRLRIRQKTIPVVEINFLCIHKKLRSKRLAPVLIKEITRRCHLEGIYQAVYTAGVILPTPVGSCRYFHRALNWLKLYEIGFSPLPPGSTKARMIARHQVSAHTATPGLRPMTSADIDSVLDLLSRYLARFDLAQEFTRGDIEHWLLSKTQSPDDRVIWAYVVADSSGKVTDLVSFYCLESSVINNTKYDKVKAVYLFYYASETAFNEHEAGLRERLLSLVGDALVEAKKAQFDVFNALTLHDNPLFLEQLKFGAGDGQLHFYLYNWRTPPISGGVDTKNKPDENQRGGIGMVLL